MKAFCQTVVASLEQGTPLALCSIASGSGSAPRTSGARMLVYPGGQILGTIGGGRYEAEIIQAAQELIYQAQTGGTGQIDPKQGSPARIMHFSLAGVDDLDMICGGELNILLEMLSPDGDTRAMFSLAAQAEHQGQGFYFVTRLNFSETLLSETLKTPGQAQIIGTVQRNLFLPAINITAGPAKNGIAKDLPGLLKRNKNTCVARTTDGTLFIEPFTAIQRAHIFGAGHVSHALAQTLELTGFKTFVLDDRQEFVTRERFPYSSLWLLHSLREEDADAYFSARHIDDNDAVVIVTRGHAFDRDVLASALKTNAGYIGMIGSKGKIKQVFDQLAQAGFERGALDKVHSPIGVEIGAETPEEIAISITAELIRWKRQS